MPPENGPKPILDTGGCSIRAKWNGRERSVAVVGVPTAPAAPKGFPELFSFVANLESRGRERPQANSTPGAPPAMKPN
jgi:hypothetical protein